MDYTVLLTLEELIILFIKGAVVGFAIAAPIGPTAILCIKRSLKGHYFHGLATGVGATLADVVFGIIAGFGLASVAALLHEFDLYIRFFGSLLIFWIGVRIYLSPPLENGSDDNGDQESLVGNVISSFFITITNPVAIIAFAAFFAAVGVENLDDSILQPISLVLGVLAGAALWWFSLTTGVYVMRHRLSQKTLTRVNHGSGLMLILFAVYILATVFWPALMV